MNIFPTLEQGKWITLNLNAESRKAGNDLADPKVCGAFIAKIHAARRAQYSYGGYLEDRTRLWRNVASERGSESLVHIGIDYSVPAGTLVYLPMNGEVIHIMKDPTNKIGWGGRIIWKLENGKYLLYGHLAQDISLTVGQHCPKEKSVGILGDTNENGNWWPHLHAQVMDETFIGHYSDEFDEIDGYLPREHRLLKHVFSPRRLIKRI